MIYETTIKKEIKETTGKDCVKMIDSPESENLVPKTYR